MYNRRMKKIIILFLICFLSYSGVNSGVVRAEVETTENKAFMSPDEVREYMKYMDEPEEVQRAREAIFNGENKIVEQIDVSEYKDYFIDKKYSPNQKFRDADFFSNGMYRIWLNRDISFMYDKGKLVYIVKKFYLTRRYISDLEFYYITNGFLKYVLYEIKDSDAYIFASNKNYLYRWHKFKLYDTKNQILLKNRPYIPFK